MMSTTIMVGKVASVVANQIRIVESTMMKIRIWILMNSRSRTSLIMNHKETI
jgi:hypothetical protein